MVPPEGFGISGLTSSRGTLHKVKEFSPCTRAAKPKHDGKWEGGILLPDHTWAPELTIHPFGIVRVEGDMGIEFDKLNRPRGKIPRTGPLTFYLRHENNSFLDASDLLKQVKEANKPVTVCIEAGSDPRGHLGVTWGVYLCAGKPPLADIILPPPPDLT